jgi:hypothetical protein
VFPRARGLYEVSDRIYDISASYVYFGDRPGLSEGSATQ